MNNVKDQELVSILDKLKDKRGKVAYCDFDMIVSIYKSAKDIVTKLLGYVFDDFMDCRQLYWNGDSRDPQWGDHEEYLDNYIEVMPSIL